MNVNFYIEPKKLKKFPSVAISMVDYFIYISFVMEILIKTLREKGYRFTDKFNVFINFESNAPDTELITFLISYLNSFYPFGLNKMHVIKYDAGYLKKKYSFNKKIKELDPFFSLEFNSSDFYDKMHRKINADMIPKSYGGRGVTTAISFDKDNHNNKNHC